MKFIKDVISKDFIETSISASKTYEPKSIIVCIVDSVFSIGVKYESTIKVVKNFSNHVKVDLNIDDYTTEDFLLEYKEYDYQRLANEVFKNRQRTSTVNGVLKSEAVVRYIKTFAKFGIKTKSDLLQFKDINMLKKEIQKIPGQKSGISFSYVMMLAGDTSLFKPDRHIINFFQFYLDYGELNEVELKVKFNEQLKHIKEDYPQLTTRTLDSIIWHFMKHERNNLVSNPSNYKKLPFFMSNKSWYYFDEDSYRFYLTREAPKEARESYHRFYKL